jgi:hypothetical protein
MSHTELSGPSARKPRDRVRRWHRSQTLLREGLPCGRRTGRRDVAADVIEVLDDDVLPVKKDGAIAGSSVAAPGMLLWRSNGWAMSSTPPMANTRAAAAIALTGLNMDWVLPVTVADWPFVAGVGSGWYKLR